MLLKIKNLAAKIDGKKVLRGLNLEIKEGEIHAIMGPNGAGKSTLAKVLAGDPSYEVTEGEVIFRGENILDKEPEERTHLGLFMSFQYPIEIPGISNAEFLHAADSAMRKARGEKLLSLDEFSKILEKKMALLEMKQEFKERSLNEGFSGGEKKRNEILQMAILSPYLAILDETDSGLDIDAMRTVAKGVKALMEPHKALLLITHYQRLLEYVRPDFVHVMKDGVIVRSGTGALAQELEEKGYQ